jgi:hypothetical protein
MTTPHVVPLTPAQYVAAKRYQTISPAELHAATFRANLAASAPTLSPRVVAAWAAR